MSFVDVFTVIGSILGSIAFAISLYLAILETPKIKIFVLGKQVFTLSPFFNKYIDEDGGHIEEYSKKHCILGIHLVFTNCSKNSTSIYEIALNDTYFLNASTENTLKTFPFNFRQHDGHLLTKDSYSYHVDYAKPVIKLEGNETIDCCISFDNVPLELSKKRHLKLIIKSSQKNYIVKFKTNFLISPYLTNDLL